MSNSAYRPQPVNKPPSALCALDDPANSNRAPSAPRDFLALLEHLADVGGERDEADEMLSEQPLARRPNAPGKVPAAVNLIRAEFEDAQRGGNRKKIVDSGTAILASSAVPP